MFSIVDYVSTEKLERIAVEVLLFPTLCFIETQLHRNSFIHNVSKNDRRAVLKHLVKSELLLCVEKGIKTSRKYTTVYIKQLPTCDLDGNVDSDQKLLFEEKLKAFKNYNSDLTIEQYLNSSMLIALDGIGVVTNELVEILSMPEYMKIDSSPLYNLKSGKMIS